MELLVIGVLSGLLLGLILGAFLGTLLARWHHAQAMRHLVHTSTLHARANARTTYGSRHSSPTEEDIDEFLRS
jgi:hypothetical protein